MLKVLMMAASANASHDRQRQAREKGGQRSQMHGVRSKTRLRYRVLLG